MFRLQLAVLAATLTVSGTLFGATSTIVNDQFLDGAFSKGSNAGEQDIPWYFFNWNSQGQAFDLTTSSSAPLSGSVMRNPGGYSSNSAALGTFASTTLGQVGDSISLNLDFVRTTSDTSRNVLLYVGLFNDNGTTVSANEFGLSSSTSADDRGYGITKYLNDATATAVRRSGSTGNQTVFDGLTALNSGLSAPATADTAAHHLSLVLTRTAQGIQVAISLDSSVLSSYVDTSPATYTFNEIGLRAQNLGSGDKILWDNIVVQTDIAPVPEPAALGLLAVSGSTVLLCQRFRK